MKQQQQKRFDLSLFKSFSFWVTLGLSLIVLSVYVLSRPEINRLPAIGILEIIEAKTLDLRFHLRGKIEPKDDIVIVAVDEKTEDELGRWQSAGRQWIAQLLNVLQAGNAKVIGFDLVFAEPDEGRDLKMLDDLKAMYQEHAPEALVTYPAILTELEDAKATHDYDRQLANAIQHAGNVVLGMYHLLTLASAAYLTPESMPPISNSSAG